jgi:hypothetical protein
MTIAEFLLAQQYDEARGYHLPPSERPQGTGPVLEAELIVEIEAARVRLDEARAEARAFGEQIRRDLGLADG